MFRNECYGFFIAVRHCSAAVLFVFSPSLHAFGSDVLAGCLSAYDVSSSILVPETELIPEYIPEGRAIVARLKADRDAPLFIFELDLSEKDEEQALVKQLSKYMIIINEYGEKEVIEITAEKHFHSEDIEREVNYQYSNHSDVFDVDTSMVYQFDGKSMGVISAAIGDKRSRETPQSSSGNSGDDSGQQEVETPKPKKPKKGLGLGVRSGEKVSKKRRLTRDLSEDSRAIRGYVNHGNQLMKSCKPGRLSLIKKYIKECDVVKNKGHRCVMKVRLQHSTDDNNSQWVLKLSDDDYEGLEHRYQDDLSIITFKTAISDLLAFLKFRDTFFEKFPELKGLVEFPASRIVVVSFSEYMDLLLSEVEAHNIRPVLKDFKGVDSNLHSGFIFLTIQEYLNLRDINQADRERFKDAIAYLHESVIDVDEKGSNLMIDSITGNLVVLDVERQQLSWDFRRGAPVDVFDGGINSLDSDLFKEYPDLNYEDISPRARRSLHKSISIDSAVASDLDSADSSLAGEASHQPRGLLQRQYSIFEERESEEGEPDEGYDAEEVFEN